MPLRILYVAYPLLSVSPESCGGAEQVLCALEREMTRRGHFTVVAASAGSRVAGELYRTGAPAQAVDQLASRQGEHHRRILQLLQADVGFDLVHDMSGGFSRHAGEVDVPVLATLHLPPALYEPGLFRHTPPNLFFNCVSRSQARTFSQLPSVLGVVENGVDLAEFVPRNRARNGGGDYLLWLGRICEEKGPHLALELAERSGAPLVLAGSVYPFRYHQEYFSREIAPRIKRNPFTRFIESPSFPEKIRLLQDARALLVTSLIDETSSLVAMEAMACGTPVIGFRRGALPEVVAQGATGLLVDSLDEMADALEQLRVLDPRVCREHVRQRFSAERMADDYEQLYQRVLEFAFVILSGAEAKPKRSRRTPTAIPDAGFPDQA
jgi:glycosyltransferase involved in cell wall biosynthesis